MDSSKYISLLVKKFKGKLGEADKASLEQWLSSPEQQDKAQQLERVWKASSQYKSAYEPDVEAGLAKFKNRIKQETTTPAREVKMRRRTFPLAWAAAIAAILLALGWWWTGNTGSEELVVTTDVNEQREISLPDGSSVVLNESSELNFSAFDQGSARVVQFSGEAYFDIKSNPQQPFIILTDETEIKVLGTSFNVRAYPAESFTEVEVESGLVEVKETGTAEGMTLKTKDRGVVVHGGTMSAKHVDHLNALSWRTQLLSFRDQPLEEIAPYLERYFKIDLEIAAALRRCPITSDFKSLSQDQVFLTLERLFNAEIEQLDTTHFKMNGSGC